MNYKERIAQTSEKLNKVSCSFCVAKWKRVTVHLQNGHTHSCYHPTTHKVPLEELKANPSALHNTQYKKSLRKMMLEGQRPEECGYCWNIEDNFEGLISDRHIKSHAEWARPYLDEVAKLPWDADVNPSYLEVSFCHECNFKCLYCLPHVSSSWQKEMEKEGDFPFSFNSIKSWDVSDLAPIAEEGNPYIEAFWRWFPDMYKDLKVLRVTGGEPLLSDNSLKLLSYVSQNEHKNLNLVFNTNLGVPASRVKSFADYYKEAHTKVQSLSIYTSIDCWGPQAEYIRSGLKLEVFKKNMDIFFEAIPSLHSTVMCTFNVLSLFSFQELLDWILEEKVRRAKFSGTINIDISYLHHPEFLSVLVAEAEHKACLKEYYSFMCEHKHNLKDNRIGFHDFEINKMQRLVEYAERGVPHFDVQEQRHRLSLYLKEIDRRRKTDHLSVFPQMKSALEIWSQTC